MILFTHLFGKPLGCQVYSVTQFNRIFAEFETSDIAPVSAGDQFPLAVYRFMLSDPLDLPRLLYF